MAEQRLIDANALTVDLTYDFTGRPMNGHRKTTFANIRGMILSQPTIDPETIPIVRQMMEELARVTAEMDAAQRLLSEHTGVVGMEKVTTCFGCPLEKVLELVLAYRDGRLIMRQEKGEEARP